MSVASGSKPSYFDRVMARMNAVLPFAVALLTILIVPTSVWVMNLERKVAQWDQLTIIRGATNDKQDSRLDALEKAGSEKDVALVTQIGKLSERVTGLEAKVDASLSKLEMLIKYEREDRKDAIKEDRSHVSTAPSVNIAARTRHPPPFFLTPAPTPSSASRISLVSLHQ